MKSGRMQKYPVKLTALALLSIYAAGAHAAQSPDNPYKLPWKCEAKDGHWICYEVPSKEPSLYAANLPKAQKRAAVARALGWIADDSDSANCSTCDGHYYEAPLPGQNQILPFKQAPAAVTYESGAYQIAGPSYLQGHVEFVQPGRVLYADKVTLTPDLMTGKPEQIAADGDVRVAQPGVLLLANNGTANMLEHQAQLDDVTYLLKVSPDISNTQKVDPNFTGYAHGQAETIQQLDENLYRLTQATYSTCPPTGNTWELDASKINLNTETGRGHAYNTVLKLKDFPAFYLPYFSFPLNHERQTGFLYGSIGNSGSTGASISLPYYFNLAPNYDWTLTPTIYSKRGVLFANEFRYLNESTTADLNWNYMPHDIMDNEDHNSVSFNSQTQVNSNWQFLTDYNYMSDQDFAQNFGNSSNIAAINQILYNRQATLKYNDSHWNFTGLMQQYQVLGSELALPNEPYNRAPEFDLGANYPGVGPFNLGFTSQYVNFQKDAQDNMPDPVVGSRTNVAPNIRLPLNWASGYFTPTLSVNNRAYALSNTNVNGLPNSSIQSSLPMFNIDSGVYFDRAFNMAGQQYTQTLEPRIYYLYVPYRNQSDIPIFDTGINTFTYSSLFQNNRFSGIDRIGDANQISTAVSTNVNNAQGQTLLTAAIGQIYYFRDRDVTICNNTPGSPPCVQTEDPYYNKPQSDLAGLFTYNFNPQWSFNSNATYNPYTASTDMQSYQFQFKPDAAHLFNFGYQDTQNDYSLLTTQQLLQGMQAPRIAQLTASFIWQLLPQWNLMGLSNYSLNEHRLISIFGGIQYSSCCWSVSLVQSRYLTSTDPNNPQIIDGPAINATVLQFELKGLGGTSDQIGLYAQQIPGYDPNLSGF